MKVILREDIPGVGKKHEVKDVSGGFVRNKLLPQEKVELATVESLKRREKMIEKLKIEEEAQLDQLKKQLKEISGKQLFLRVKANEEGHLFAGLHKKDLAKEFENRFSITFSPEQFVFDEPIKELGTYDITIETKAGTETFTLKIEKE